MRTFPRWMPKPEPVKVICVAWLLVPALGFAAYCLVYRHPLLLAGFVGFCVLMVIGSISFARDRRRLLAQRRGESICTFVRAFDCRKTDTWVLRAVYEELTQLISVDDRPIPLRADDRWEEDLGVDPEDMEDLLKDIARRAGRSLENTKTNAHFSKESLKTIRGLVLFLQHQPKVLTPGQVEAMTARTEPDG